MRRLPSVRPVGHSADFAADGIEDDHRGADSRTHIAEAKKQPSRQVKANAAAIT